MKQKWTIALVAILTFTLILSGCAVLPQSAGTIPDDQRPYVGSTARAEDGAYGYGSRGRSETAGNDAVTEIGNGGYGGYGGYGNEAGTGYADDCDPIYDGTVTADPNYTLTEAAPGLDPDFVNRAVVDVMSAVERDVMGNRNVVDGVSRLMSSGLTQDDLNNAVGYVLDRARPLMAVHMKSALDFWSKAARPQTQPAPAVSPKPAVKPVAPNAPPTTQRVPGTTPQQTSSVTPPDSFIKEGRAKGWDNLRIMQQWASNRK